MTLNWPKLKRPKETQINVTGQPSCVAGSTLDERKNPPYYFSPYISSTFVEELCYSRTVVGDRDPSILRVVGILIFDVKFK